MGEIRIEITGPTKTGKTTLAYLIKAILVELKFDAAVFDEEASHGMMNSLTQEELGQILEERLSYIPRDSLVSITTKTED